MPTKYTVVKTGAPINWSINIRCIPIDSAERFGLNGTRRDKKQTQEWMPDNAQTKKDNSRIICV